MLLMSNDFLFIYFSGSTKIDHILNAIGKKNTLTSYSLGSYIKFFCRYYVIRQISILILTKDFCITGFPGKFYLWYLSSHKIKVNYMD